MIAIVDYGIGNLRSIEKAFEAVGADVVRSDRREDIRAADKVVLPGVGAFGACIDEIRRRKLEEPILGAIREGKPFLGVCVGMQLLFESSEEMGQHKGLGVLPGRVLHFTTACKTALYKESPEDPLKIPHMGWNTVDQQREDPLFSRSAFSTVLLFCAFLCSGADHCIRHAGKLPAWGCLSGHCTAKQCIRGPVSPREKPGKRPAYPAEFCRIGIAPRLKARAQTCAQIRAA